MKTLHPGSRILLVLALLQGAWLLFDGGRALIVGDYVTATTGPYAGQLGPWSHLVAAVGLEPRGSFVKGLHVVLGIFWLMAAGCLAVRPVVGRAMAFGGALATLWYLPIGTVASLIIIGLLVIPHFWPQRDRPKP